MDLVIMPSRTEGFGLTALEALSAGLPVLAGHDSGFSKALQKVEFGELCVVTSDKPEVWSEAIKNVHQKERKKRLKEMQRLRESYGQKYNWAQQCEILVKKMRTKVFGRQLLFFPFLPYFIQTFDNWSNDSFWVCFLFVFLFYCPFIRFSRHSFIWFIDLSFTYSFICLLIHKSVCLSIHA